MKRATDWPRYLKRRRLRSGGYAFYWIPHERDRTAGFTIGPESLGGNFEAAAQRARFLNEHLDAWRTSNGLPAEVTRAERVGTIDWWHGLYFAHTAFQKLKPRTQQDYRDALGAIAELPTKITDAATGLPTRMGLLPAASLSPQAVDKIYERLRDGGRVNRQADYAMDVARRAWTVVARQHPGMFLVPVTGADGKVQRLAINPFVKMVRADYERDTARPATRDQAYALAGALELLGHPALGVGALICFEWLQRPADVIAGRLSWTNYRPAERPNEVMVVHHKTGKTAWQPLYGQPDDDTGEPPALYPELVERINRLERLGVPVVMFRPKRGPKGSDGLRLPRVYSESHAQHLVQKARSNARLPAHVTLEACRHGGMTELGDCGLTEQEIMSLSTHATPAAARIYVKRTEAQRRAAAAKRRAAIAARGGRPS